MIFLNWSIFIAAIALLISIISPILTAIINNHYKIKEYKSEFYEKHRAEVIERYLNSVGSTLYRQDLDDIREYGRSFAEIYLYVPSYLWDTLDKIGFEISEKNYDAAKGLLAELSKKLSCYPPRTKKKKSKYNMQ